MIEVNPALAEVGKEHVEDKTPTPMQEIDLAFKECCFGRFQIRILSTALVGFIAGVLVTNSTAYILPIAECDLNMNLIKKGALNGVTFLGMMITSLIGGFLVDTFGRKFFLVVGYGGIFVFTIICGTSQTFEVFVVAKFFEGMMFALAFSPTVTMTSEFCSLDIRDRMMLCQSSFAAIGQIVAALISWSVLIPDWKYSLFGGYIVLNIWNFYLYIVSLWSLFACILYSTLPESPKYLVAQQKYDEAREILIKVYTSNTGKPADTFAYVNLWRDKVKHAIDEAPEHNAETTLKHQIVLGLQNVKSIFNKPYVMYLMLFAAMNFLIMCLYNVLRLWYPQLSTIIEHKGLDGDKDLCVMLDEYTSELSTRSNNATGPNTCIVTKGGSETYMNSIILGLVCLVPYFVSGALVNRVGKKRLLLVAGVLCVAATFGLRWSNSKPMVITLYSIDTSLAQMVKSLTQATVIDFFPTSMRTIAFSFAMLLGRIGTLVGNISFPILLGLGCQIPFFTLTGLMSCVVLMGIFLPTKRPVRPTTQQTITTEYQVVQVQKVHSVKSFK